MRVGHKTGASSPRHKVGTRFAYVCGAEVVNLSPPSERNHPEQSCNHRDDHDIRACKHQCHASDETSPTLGEMKSTVEQQAIQEKQAEGGGSG
jgi:hypothetical protein